jgi:hypothetical protein
MKRTACILTVFGALAWTAPAFGAEQNPIVEHPRRVGQDVGFSFLAAATNIVYFPARLAVTAVTAHVGGLAAWLNGGDQLTAQAIWDSTDGQAYITPDILEGRERLHFGVATHDQFAPPPHHGDMWY